METPCSSRRVTRSQTAAAAASASNNRNNPNPVSRKWEDSDEAGTKPRQSGGNGKQPQEVRSALLDITNDSPIVGLAVGSLKTPLSSVAKKRGDGIRVKSTPGSGEALLRSQVKNLLQKVEEEAEISKVPMESRVPFFRLQGLVNGSPAEFFAPTPANTPQVFDGLSDSDSGLSKEQLISKVLNDIFEGKEEEEDGVESQIGLVTRSLLLDFSEKSDVTHDPSDCSSDLTFQGDSSGESKEKSTTTDDDNASIWSIQVNASTQDAEEEREEEKEEEEEDEQDYDEEEEQGDGGFIDELCNGMENMFVNEKKNVAAKFEGKHTRFVYDSDDEMVAEEVKGSKEDNASPGVVSLKGMPTPRGKHTRFSEEADE